MLWEITKMTPTIKLIKLTTDGERIGLKCDADKSYEALSQGVGGWIECVRLTPTLDMWVNEEGKMNGLEYNPDATAVFWSHFGVMSDIIVGDVVFASHDDEGNTTSLSTEEIQYLEKYLNFDLEKNLNFIF
jgi:hypothetical protein